MLEKQCSAAEAIDTVMHRELKIAKGRLRRAFAAADADMRQDILLLFCAMITKGRGTMPLKKLYTYKSLQRLEEALDHLCDHSITMLLTCCRQMMMMMTYLRAVKCLQPCWQQCRR